MKTASIKVSYRDKEKNETVSLGTIEVPRFDNLEEAVEYFDAENPGKGEGDALEYVHTALDIELQRRHRDANRTDKPKVTSNTAKFRQLSPEAQEAALRAAGVI